MWQWHTVVPKSNLLLVLKDADDLHGFDPYLIWADIRRFRGFQLYDERTAEEQSTLDPFSSKADLENKFVGVIVENQPRDVDDACAEQQTTDQVKKADDPFRLFDTTIVQLSNIASLKNKFCRFQLAIPRFELSGVPLLPPVSPADEYFQDRAAEIQAGLKRQLSTQETPDMQNPETRICDDDLLASFADLPVVGIIDHGIGILNRSFSLVASQTDSNTGQDLYPRVVALWDQDRTAPDIPIHYDPPFHYGRHHHALKIKEAFLVPNEQRGYKKLGYETLRDRRSHGTHVLSMLAGSVNPASRLRELDEHGKQIRSSPRDDFASLMPIVAVQLPYKPEKDTSGGVLSASILDGIRYILEMAKSPTEEDPHRHRPVVINISDGANAGSHRGASILETAIDHMFSTGELDREKDAIVLAAGNAYQMDAHAEGLLASGTSGNLTVALHAQEARDTFIEIWFEGDGTGVTIEVQPPTGPAHEVESSEISAGTHSGKVPSFALFGPRSVPQDAQGPCDQDGWATRSMALIAIAGTRPSSDDAGSHCAPAGFWKIKVTNTCSQTIRFDAWIERKDNPYAERPYRRQIKFVTENPEDKSSDPKSRITGDNTLNSIATGASQIVVGGYAFKSKKPAKYTSAGTLIAGGSPPPTASAPSDESSAYPGLRVSATYSHDTVRVNGTSIAAPFLGRALINSLVQDTIGDKTNSDRDSLKERLHRHWPGSETQPDKRLGTGKLASTELRLPSAERSSSSR